MKTINYLQGDATTPPGPGNRIICHICNDLGGWGRGFVLAVSKRWKQPEAEYRAWHRAGSAGGFALGATQFVPVANDLWVANMIAQHGMRSKDSVPPIRYDAVRASLTCVADKAYDLRASVHMPRIGCGLAGGNWAEIEPIIIDTLCVRDLAVYVYDL